MTRLVRDIRREAFNEAFRDCAKELKRLRERASKIVDADDEIPELVSDMDLLITKLEKGRKDDATNP